MGNVAESKRRAKRLMHKRARQGLTASHLRGTETIRDDIHAATEVEKAGIIGS